MSEKITKETAVLPSTGDTQLRPCQCLEEAARRLTAQPHPFASYFRDISVECCDGLLTLRGRLPTFYMKQILQTSLRNIDGVEQIDNQVDVISATGLSDVRPK